MNQQEHTLRSIFFICGALEQHKGELYKGGCGKKVSAWDSYRCSDCTAAFHRVCIRKHFGPKHKKHWSGRGKRIIK